MSINLINYALTKKDWNKAYEDLKVLEKGGRNLIKDSNNFTNYTKYLGATATFTTGVSVTEWGATDATRIQTSGGTSTVKLYKIIVAPSVNGQQYTVSIWLKNIGNYPVVVNSRLNKMTINAGEQKRVVLVGTGDGTNNVQINFETTSDNISNPLDFIVWRAKVELGNRATDWTPAPEDINAHPFVAELAETVYRSKQNEERIRALENALTALGGGS